MEHHKFYSYISLREIVLKMPIWKGGGHCYNNNFKLTGKTNYCQVWTSLSDDIHERSHFVTINILVVLYINLLHA
jgi:hypothetical protein